MRTTPISAIHTSEQTMSPTGLYSSLITSVVDTFMYNIIEIERKQNKLNYNIS